MLQSTIADVVFDENNFCWLSYPNGIQQFDGEQFKIITPQPGLPATHYTRLFHCSNGDLLISHSYGISKYEPATNRFTLIYSQDSTQHSVPQFIGEDEGDIFFYDGKSRINTMACGSYKLLRSVHTGLTAPGSENQYLLRFSNIVKHRVAFWLQNDLCFWDLRENRLLSRLPGQTERNVTLLYMPAENQVYFNNFSDRTNILSYNFTTRKMEKKFISGKDNSAKISRFNIYRWKEKYLVSINNHLYETDSTFLNLKAEIVNFQNLPVAANFSIANMAEDHYGNLFLQTVNGGIRKIIRNNYPIKYFGTLNRDINSVLGILPDKKNNRVLIGTNGSGLLIYDTQQHLVKHFSNHPEGLNFFGINAIIKNNNGDYLLFSVWEDKLWKLTSDLSAFTRVPVTETDTQGINIGYFGNTIYRNSRMAVAQSGNMVYFTDLYSNKITARYTPGIYILAHLWKDDQIIWHVNDSLYYTDQKNLQNITKIPFPGTAGVRCMTEDAGGHILMGTNNGIFITDHQGNILEHRNTSNGLPDDCIYALTTDAKGDIWASSNKGVFRIDSGGHLLQLTRENGLQENEFNTGIVATAEDGELFFGGVNGVSSFYPEAFGIRDEQINLLMTRIRVNNTDVVREEAPWNIRNLNLQYNLNALSFDFIAMGNNNPSQYIYQYRMKGVDHEWIQNTGLQTVRYSLAPGTYTFQVYASRSFNKDAEPMAEIRIHIEQPFWKSWWFISGLLLLVTGTAVYIISAKNRRKFDRKLQQLENEQKLKNERERISRDLHDNLGAYANAVIYNTELLEKDISETDRQELITGLRYASRDIITSLRETVWALKKEEYSAEECFLRIRNFIQPLARYYPDISFSIEGKSPVQRKLPYSNALNLVRIVQEAVSNSIKHSGATCITVESTVTDSEWKLVIRDNGSGFNVESARKEEQGNGLGNMADRARNSGFGYSLESSREGGTQITLLV